MNCKADETANQQSRSPRLNRTTFETSRLLEFCSEKELTAQIGHEKEEWPRVALKELLDNALDACEEAGVPPEITVTVDSHGIAVSDNGPGIPTDTVDGVLNFSVRASSREAYVAPDRGAQGNALKTLVAMPFVLDGNRGRVDVSANGERHEITFGVDPIREEPIIQRETHSAQNVRTGTLVRIWWPDSALLDPGGLESQFLTTRRRLHDLKSPFDADRRVVRRANSDTSYHATLEEMAPE
ncbi:MAG TPA: ATP-binding protein [Thermoguttaceae bacterium]|nr:ATP-binding protein [Thermoguttaceae bacterium]